MHEVDGTPGQSALRGGRDQSPRGMSGRIRVLGGVSSSKLRPWNIEEGQRLQWR